MRSALDAESPENEFTFTNNPLAEGAPGRLGEVVPIKVLNIAAAVADEMVVLHAFGIESRRPTFDGYFTHQARLHQIPQIVIRGSPRRSRIQAIHACEDFRSRGMPLVFHQECHHGVALGSAPQSAAFQGPSNRLSVYQRFRLCLI